MTKERQLEIKARYRATHKQELLEKHRQCNREHREEIKAYYTAHKEKKIKYQHQYYETHKDEASERGRKYNKNERGKVVSAVCRARRRARMMGVFIDDLTSNQWQERLEEYNGLCAYCLRPVKTVTQDHMTPLSRDGNHTLSNVVPCCKSCNSKKHNKTLLEYVISTHGNFV